MRSVMRYVMRRVIRHIVRHVIRRGMMCVISRIMRCIMMRILGLARYEESKAVFFYTDICLTFELLRSMSFVANWGPFNSKWSILL
jgi:hypothetical protein